MPLSHNIKYLASNFEISGNLIVNGEVYLKGNLVDHDLVVKKNILLHGNLEGEHGDLDVSSNIVLGANNITSVKDITATGQLECAKLKIGNTDVLAKLNDIETRLNTLENLQ